MENFFLQFCMKLNNKIAKHILLSIEFINCDNNLNSTDRKMLRHRARSKCLL